MVSPGTSARPRRCHRSDRHRPDPQFPSSCDERTPAPPTASRALGALRCTEPLSRLACQPCVPGCRVQCRRTRPPAPRPSSSCGRRRVRGRRRCTGCWTPVCVLSRTRPPRFCPGRRLRGARRLRAAAHPATQAAAAVAALRSEGGVTHGRLWRRRRRVGGESVSPAGPPALRCVSCALLLLVTGRRGPPSRSAARLRIEPGVEPSATRATLRLRSRGAHLRSTPLRTPLLYH